MDEEKKKKLMEKRKKLKRKLEIDEMLKGYIFEELDKNNISYKFESLLTKEEYLDKNYKCPFQTWLYDRFILHSYGKLDESSLEDKLALNENKFDSLETLLKNIIQEKGLDNVTVIVLWSHAYPIISLKLHDIFKIAPDLLNYGVDTYLFDLEDDWIIEYYHEGVVTFGRSKS